MTRQRRWQLKMKALGRCTQCGATRVTRAYCRKCADKAMTFSLPRAKAWHAADPLRGVAHTAVNLAVRSGRLIRPVECSRCGISDPKINAHHHDYSKPLDVEWLCYRCHAVVEGRGQK